MVELLKTGISFNFKYMRENKKEIWDKYKDDLIEGFPAVKTMEIVYMNELVEYIDGKVLLTLLDDLLPNDYFEVKSNSN